MIDAEALAAIQEASYGRATPALRSSWPRESAMDGGTLAAFLAERRYCVLATTDARDHAQARPVAFTVMGAAFWFATGAGPRLRNLERTPWVSVVVAEGERGRHRAVTADGPVTIAPEPPAGLAALWEARHERGADWASAWFELRPTRLYSYRGSNGP